MSEEYTPPEVWSPPAAPGGTFANINRPTSGATQEKELPRGEHPTHPWEGPGHGVRGAGKVEDQRLCRAHMTYRLHFLT